MTWTPLFNLMCGSSSLSPSPPNFSPSSAFFTLTFSGRGCVWRKFWFPRGADCTTERNRVCVHFCWFDSFTCTSSMFNGKNLTYTVSELLDFFQQLTSSLDKSQLSLTLKRYNFTTFLGWESLKCFDHYWDSFIVRNCSPKQHFLCFYLKASWR